MLYHIQIFLQHGAMGMSWCGRHHTIYPLHTLLLCLCHQLCGVLAALHDHTGYGIIVKMTQENYYCRQHQTSSPGTSQDHQLSKQYILSCLRQTVERTVILSIMICNIPCPISLIGAFTNNAQHGINYVQHCELWLLRELVTPNVLEQGTSRSSLYDQIQQTDIGPMMHHQDGSLIFPHDQPSEGHSSH